VEPGAFDGPAGGGAVAETLSLVPTTRATGFVPVPSRPAAALCDYCYGVLNRIAAAILLTAFAPVFVFVAWRIWREDGAPVFFVQHRVGRNGKIFGCYKFRTMCKNAEQMLDHWHRTNDPIWQEYCRNNFKLRDDPRLLVGSNFVRKTSLDELPQLINVLKGEMHLVGPRPLIPREIPYYGPTFSLYCSVPPGITGLWQVGGRSDTAFQDRVKLDADYVHQRSARLDIKILFRTLGVLARASGAY
jgi:undecaprenyl-phosphate galactose phosphotransferase